MTITILNRQKAMPINSPRLKCIARKVLVREGIVRARLSFVFVTDREIRSLNQKYLGRLSPTDVLAFNLTEGKEHPLTGDIIISTTTALKQARGFHTTPFYEIVLYMIHGILHLMGFDQAAPQSQCPRRSAPRSCLGS